MVEFIDDRLEQLDRNPADMTIDTVQLRGIYDVEESGSGITEKYRSEREAESGGSDEVDQPPAPTLKITAWGTWTEFQELDALRDRDEPFPVSVGPFAFDEMGITNLEADVEGDYPSAVGIKISLQEYREVTIQRQTISEITQRDSENLEGRSEASEEEEDLPESQVGSSTEEEGDGSGGGGDSGVGAGTGSGDTSGVTTETIASGARPQYNVGSGETYGGVLLDNNGGRPIVSATGSNWVVRDIGLSGAFNGSSGGNGNAFMGLNPSGGDNLVENIYMGDGSTNHRDTGIWINNSASGSASITIRHANGQTWNDNFIYGSAPTSSLGLLIEECYGQDNGISSYRLKDGTVRNCVAYHSGSNTPTTGRAVWAWRGGHTNVDGGDFLAQGSAQYCLAASGGDPEDGVANVTVSGGATMEGPIAGGGSHVEWGNSSQSGANVDNYSDGVPETAAEAAEGN